MNKEEMMVLEIEELVRKLSGNEVTRQARLEEMLEGNLKENLEMLRDQINEE